MAKIRHSVNLYGMMDNNVQAKTSDADNVSEFWGNTHKVKGYFKVTHPDLGPVTITTPLGIYCEEGLNPHATVHKFDVNGTKINVSFKKIVGKLIYWA